MLTIIIIAHNEEKMIEDSLKSAAFADEIIVSDKKSTDKTVEIAQKYKALIHHFSGDDFDKWRNEALEKAKGDWIFYLDPDERIDENLKREILTIVKPLEKNQNTAFRLPRTNYWWGKKFKYCGAWPDYVTRLFWKRNFKNWFGAIHESPNFTGNLGTLTNPLIHYTHRDINSVMQKSLAWTQKEAQLFFEANHKPVKIKNLVSVFCRKFIEKYCIQKGFMEGIEGLIESMVQAINRLMVYIFLWEKQKGKKI